jgi:hypothetical protein
MRRSAFRGVVTLLSAMLALPLPAGAQTGIQSASPVPAPADAAQLYNREQLDALLAPIALYPDTLLTQILMASTLPVQVLQARLWLDNPANKALAGDVLAKALEAQSWDPSVKSLVPFPQVLVMMADKADWMQQLGYAMAVQQPDVLDSVQRLRFQAQQAGSLTTTPQQKVVSTPRPSAPPIIVIEPADPQIIYVPSYNPAQVYGAWPYPATPPVYLPPPPGYAIGTALVSGMAFAAGAAVVGSLWNIGRPAWGNGSVSVNVNHWNSVNVNRPPIQNGNWRPPAGGTNIGRPPGAPGGPVNRPIRPPGGPVGMPQRANGLSANAIGRPSVSVPGNAVNRPARAPGTGGFAQGDTSPSRPPAGSSRPLQNQGGATQNRPSAGKVAQRPVQRPADQRPAARPARSPEAFSGMREGRQAPAFANRGAQSRNPGGGGGGVRSGGRNGDRGGGGGRRH